MYDRMQTFSIKEINKLHDSSMDILQNLGIVFHSPETIDLFKRHNFTVDQKIVYFKEKQVMNALDNCPTNFTIIARNSENNIKVGLDEFAFLPGYGAVFIISPEGDRREGTLGDYINFCKLTQTSKYIDMNGFLLVTPSDVSPETAHLDMIYSNIIYCDKAFMGSSLSKFTAKDSVEMAGIVWGSKDNIKNQPVMVNTMSGIAPLQWAGETTDALIEFAKYGQPCIVRGFGMRGATMPITLSGSIAVQNAMTLAAITLAQLVNPGTPIVYGGAPSPLNMKNGTLAAGLPEYSMSVSAVAQMARFYNLPSRESGAVTDSHLPDYQAGIESALLLSTCVRNGINLILTSCGMLSSFMAMSYEKFVIDDEFCGMVRKLVHQEEVTDESIGMDEIKDIGFEGGYLYSSRTNKLCRTEFFLRDIMNEKRYSDWKSSGKRRVDEVAVDKYQKRLSLYEKPVIESEIDRDLRKYIAKRKSE
jgi:trimethylamine--corrinoid protein Co-methyltransferase